MYKPGIPEWGTECGERGKGGECYVSGNVPKHFGKYRQIFQEMSSKIPGNICVTQGNEDARSVQDFI